MIRCAVCKKLFCRITSAHLEKHDIKNESEYIKLYPHAKLYDKTYIKNLSQGTKIAMSKMDKKKFHLAIEKRNAKPGYSQKIAKSVSKLHADGEYKHIYTKERNSKIGKYMKKFRADNIEMYREIGAQIQKTVHKRKGPNKFEKSLYDILDREDIKYEAQYKLERKLYDAMLPKFRVLLEFDGKFYHRNSLKECDFAFQVRNYHNDKSKNAIAKKNGFRIIRIKEGDEVNSIRNLL